MKLELIILLAFITINALTFALFGWDKALARNGDRRISEKTLLRFSFIGGTVGALSATQYFRHKTRKQPFAFQLKAIAVLQIAAATLWLTGWWTKLLDAWEQFV